VLGATAAHAPQAEQNALQSFGLHVGLAFQVTDDILDIFGPVEPGKDFLEKKKGNIVLHYAFKQFSPAQRKTFLKLFDQKKLSSKDTNRLILLVRNTGALQQSQSLAKKQVLLATQSLNPLKDSAPKSELVRIANSLLERKL